MSSRSLALVLSLAAAPAAAQTALPGADWPLRIPAPGGDVILPAAPAKRAYDEMGYASSRRVGDTLYVSGVIAGGGRPGRPADPAVFRESLRQAFQRIGLNLKAAGAGFGDVVMINSFHVWQSPYFTGTQEDHFRVFSEVKSEFMRPPHAAWTAVGTTGLLAPAGLVEIQMIARIPSPTTSRP